MNDDLTTCQCKWCSIKIKDIVYLCIGQDEKINTRWLEHIQCDYRIPDQMRTTFDEEIIICSGKDGNEVIFKGIDGPFYLANLVIPW